MSISGLLFEKSGHFALSETVLRLMVGGLIRDDL